MREKMQDSSYVELYDTVTDTERTNNSEPGERISAGMESVSPEEIPHHTTRAQKPLPWCVQCLLFRQFMYGMTVQSFFQSLTNLCYEVTM